MVLCVEVINQVVEFQDDMAVLLRIFSCVSLKFSLELEPE